MKTPPRESTRTATKGLNSNGHATAAASQLKGVPVEWAWHYQTLQHLRERLSRASAEHASEAASPAEMLGVDTTDTTQERLDRSLLWAELAAEENQLVEVEAALQRLRDGVYGFCEETGLPIPPDRLRAVPWTRYCRTAAERHEHHDTP